MNMDRQKRRKNAERKHRSMKAYAAGAIALAALIFAAFFLPQLVFHVQDDLRCRDYQFDMQEVQDITLLSTSYETSLYNRLLRFAEDEQSGAKLYVTSQEMTPNQELYDFLESVEGLQQSNILMLMDTGLFSYSLIYDYQVTDWKQYVIYSDNYARGVNFIIWYIELEQESGAVLRLLLDAETGSLYGIQSDYEAMREQAKVYSDTMREQAAGEKKVYSNTLIDFLGVIFGSAYNMAEAWMSLAYCYGGFDERADFFAESEKLLQEMESYGYDTEIDGYLKAPYAEKEISWIGNDSQWSVRDYGKELEFVFPYGEYSQKFLLNMSGDVIYVEDYYAMLADVTVGFPSIYELIPEFAASQNGED